ncbi:MAG: hypothetical protein KAU50_03205, partial [Candidatus Marinimicrobia bacterium]|nr:hypothetical protein [Candidatus Neomarinimicrobiota bacterium]
PDESALFNKALHEVKTTWALFLNQQEVLHTNDSLAFLAYLDDPDVLAYDLPIMHLSEPNNYHFETRLIRADAGIQWQHCVYPSLGESIEQVAEKKSLESPVGLIPIAVIVSLGDPDPEEWELRDTLVRVERELDQDPESARYWYHRAVLSRLLDEGDRAHTAVEEGLSVVGKHSALANREPEGVNGLIGMFCEVMLQSSFLPEKTIESLYTIFMHMPGDGRFSVPLGRILQAQNRRTDASEIQRLAISTFLSDRRYHLSLEDGLFKPAQLMWEFAAQNSDTELLKRVIDLQTQLKQRKFDSQQVLQYVYAHNESLFIRIQKILQLKLKK